MKKLFTTILFITLISNNLNANEGFIIYPLCLSESCIQEPPTFILTEMNGRELEDYALFKIKYDNTFELVLTDGTVYKYKPIKHFGDEPLCNILALDNFGRKTAICIKILSGNAVKVMLENDEKISNFRGIKK